MSATKRLRVAVSGLHLGENAQSGPGVIRSLREALGDGVELVGLAYDAMDSALYVPGLLDDAFLLPYPSAGPEAYFDRLRAIHDEGALDVLIPCLDVELPVLHHLAPRLAALGIALCLPSPGALARRAKERLGELSAEVGVATPETVRVGEAGALAAAGERLGYPMLVKGPFCEAEVAHGPAEAVAAFQRLATRWGLPLLAQRFVHGDEFDVVALGDGRGGVHGPVAMRKTIVTRLGKAWGAVTVADDELLDISRRVVAALQWRGPCEVEMLRAAGSRLHLIELNPRFPAWVYLATAAGVNLPLGLVRLARGEPLPPYGAYRIGVCYVRHAAEAVGDIADIESLVMRGRARRRPASSGAQPAPAELDA